MDYKKIHFIGIGGAGMSGIAKVLLSMGYNVSGSDLKESRNTLALKEQGAKIVIGHNPKNINFADVVVVSSAIKENNSELKFAREKKVPVLKRAEMLSKMSEGKIGIAVAGTHGKTTTTSIISSVFEQNNLDPTFLIGGELNDIGSNAKYGKGEFFIAEADESDGSLLFLKPKMIVITNIEKDHLDYFKSIEDIESTFLKFVESLPPDGHLIINGDHPTNKKFIKKIKSKYITYGFEESNDYQAKNLKLGALDSSFDLFVKNKKRESVHLNLPGRHNICNSLAAFAIGNLAGIKFSDVANVLAEFNGVKRRFQVVGDSLGITVVDDYAHHPSEVKVTLDAAKQGDWGRIVCVFQPHRYSRTKFLARDFGNSFNQADVVIVTDIYGAGEMPEPGIDGKLILNFIIEENPRSNAVYLPKKVDVKDFLSIYAEKGDLILTMGAGDIHLVGEDFLLSLKEKEAISG
ncbi:UDP-N-acetylmuramate--L-alanine ligase [Candidatus Oleimmundimicrobium sp.]|uniref:UDP-N-acetylmuramate--L-alanine ligase n=1 Tax=Candidatus Oleimmundimicrobium sp. TaxID=3060597 RepID=UPI002722CF1F|nr:UDP-N-acetylmuramate--L-alanine ligase [Candidatus Oleimmundimicrobium sp.]MDO8885510.1 UDP-N-acetylmuramate--L-alanine ligase [Candidatus Oleimmundimicrobium sp.]